MKAAIKFSNSVLHKLNILARNEGTTTPDLICRIVEAYVAESRIVDERDYSVRLPMISAAETGPIRAVSGSDIDDLLSRDNFSS